MDGQEKKFQNQVNQPRPVGTSETENQNKLKVLRSTFTTLGSEMWKVRSEPSQLWSYGVPGSSEEGRDDWWFLNLLGYDKWYMIQAVSIWTRYAETRCITLPKLSNCKCTENDLRVLCRWQGSLLLSW